MKRSKLKMLLLLVALVGVVAAQVVVPGAPGSCEDVSGFTDENGQSCASWAAFEDCRDATGISAAGLEAVLANCQATCNSCVKAAQFCEIGLGGDTVKLDPPTTDDFDFIDQENLDQLCRWSDKPEGLHMNSNAWVRCCPGGVFSEN